MCFDSLARAAAENCPSSLVGEEAVNCVDESSDVPATNDDACVAYRFRISRSVRNDGHETMRHGLEQRK